MPTLSQFMLVAAGGALGACARFAVQHFSFFRTDKFYLTAIVNLAGCLLIGAVWSILNHIDAPKWVYNTAMAGFLGGFTTFSSFSLDAIQLFNQGRVWEASAYILLSVAGGLAFCVLGLWLADRIIFSNSPL